MNTRRSVIAHILRTVLLVGLLSLVSAGLVAFGIWLRLHYYVILAALAVVVGAWVYFSARWHPYWAPIATRTTSVPWRDEFGVDMETCVEVAQIQGSQSSILKVLRVSIYRKQGSKLTKRVLIGDSACFLGVFSNGLWFFINDRFYARRDGLVCVDVKSAGWRYHQPRSSIELVDQNDRQRHLIEVRWHGIEKEIDLARIETAPVV